MTFYTPIYLDLTFVNIVPYFLNLFIFIWYV